jgi:hypothetical protein
MIRPIGYHLSLSRTYFETMSALLCRVLLDAQR